MRGKRGPSGRGRIARAAQPSSGWDCSERGLLLFDVLADDGDRRSSAG